MIGIRYKEIGLDGLVMENHLLSYYLHLLTMKEIRNILLMLGVITCE